MINVNIILLCAFENSNQQQMFNSMSPQSRQTLFYMNTSTSSSKMKKRKGIILENNYCNVEQRTRTLETEQNEENYSHVKCALLMRGLP